MIMNAQSKENLMLRACYEVPHRPQYKEEKKPVADRDLKADRMTRTLKITQIPTFCSKFLNFLKIFVVEDPSNPQNNPIRCKTRAKHAILRSGKK